MNKFAIITFAALSFSGLASASLIPSLVNAAGGVYTYDVALDQNEQLNNTLTLAGNTCSSSGAANVACGQFFTLFDIPNLTAATAAPGFTFSVQLVGVKNDLTGLAIPDSGGLNNVTFTYTGAPVTGPAMFTGFTITAPGTVLSPTANIAFAFNTPHNPDTGFADQGAGVVQGPMSAVPEPGSMLLIGGGLIGLVSLRRKLVH